MEVFKKASFLEEHGKKYIILGKKTKFGTAEIKCELNEACIKYLYSLKLQAGYLNLGLMTEDAVIRELPERLWKQCKLSFVIEE